MPEARTGGAGRPRVPEGDTGRARVSEGDAGRPGPGRHAGDRAVSEVLGYAMIFSLIVASIGIVTVGGLGSLQDARVNEQISNADRAFDVLHDNLADVHGEGAPSRSTEIALGDADLFFGDNVSMAVSVDGTVHEARNVRPIVFRLDSDRFLVYEFGATLRVERAGGIVMNEPPFTATDGGDVVHVPMVRTTARDVQSIGSTNVLVHGQADGRSVRHQTVDGTATFDWIRLDSPRYEIWADYFAAQPYCSVAVNHAAEQVTCDVTSPYEDPDRLYLTLQEIRLDLIT